MYIRNTERSQTNEEDHQYQKKRLYHGERVKKSRIHLITGFQKSMAQGKITDDHQSSRNHVREQTRAIRVLKTLPSGKGRYQTVNAGHCTRSALKRSAGLLIGTQQNCKRIQHGESHRTEARFLILVTLITWTTILFLTKSQRYRQIHISNNQAIWMP